MARTEDELAKAIQETYAQAKKEVKEKLEDFIAKHKAKDARMKKQVEEGKISAADYKDWQKGQLFTQKQWKQKLKDVTRIYTTADERAREIISSKRIDVFADAANHVAYEIERDQGFSGAVSFNLYDSRTVEQLLKDDPQMLPEWKINEPKDYVWNYKRVKNAVTQGIIQGESVGQIGKRLSEELSTSNARKMDMFARTAVTGAQNAGRIERMRESIDMGIDVKKKWLATLDMRTRDAHRDLDGKEQDVDKPFLIEGKKIDYPGDPKAPAELVYNCRCTLTYVYPKYKSMQDAGMRRDQETGAVIPNTTYRQWEAMKKGISPKEEKKKIVPRHVSFTPAKTIQEAEEYAKRFLGYNGKASYRGIGLEYANACNKVLSDVQATYDVSGLGSISAMNMRSNLFKNSTAEAAYRWGGRDLFINPKYYKNKALFEKHKKEIDDLMEIVLNGGQKLLDSGNMTDARKDYIHALLKTKRQCVSQSYDFVEGTFVHECGHRLDDDIFFKELKAIYSENNGSYSSKLSESRKKYGGSISGYAISSNQEYMAESFTAWWFGEGDKCDPTIVGVFERMMKHE